MDVFRIVVGLHIVLAIVIVGLALFWAIMLVALRQKFDASQTAHHLQQANAARWPHVVVPYALRLPLPYVMWAMLVLVSITGYWLLQAQPRGESPWLTIKLALLGALVVLQIIVTRRPAPMAIRVVIALSLLLVVVSALMVRS